MELIVSRLSEFYMGAGVYLKDGDNIETIAHINGNKPDFSGPVILTGIDQDILYGMSHRQVVSRIYTKGPQVMLTTKELGHKLFEHGMKAALGKVRLGNNTFMSSLETYYTITGSYGAMKVVSSQGRVGCLIKPHANYEPILLTTGAFVTESGANRIDVDQISTQVTRRFNLSSNVEV